MFLVVCATQLKPYLNCIGLKWTPTLQRVANGRSVEDTGNMPTIENQHWPKPLNNMCRFFLNRFSVNKEASLWVKRWINLYFSTWTSRVMHLGGDFLKVMQNCVAWAKSASWAIWFFSKIHTHCRSRDACKRTKFKRPAWRLTFQILKGCTSHSFFFKMHLKKKLTTIIITIWHMITRMKNVMSMCGIGNSTLLNKG